MKVGFTADENDAMSRTLDRYASIANAHAPEGMRMFGPAKVIDAVKAQGLTEYVEDLKRDMQNCDSSTNINTLMDKAIKAQMKAYLLHNLPVYMFQLAEMYELAGDVEKSREFSQLFQQVQDEFTPDPIDTIFLEMIETVKGLEKEGCEISSKLRYELDRILVAKKLHESGFLCFSQGR